MLKRLGKEFLLSPYTVKELLRFGRLPLTDTSVNEIRTLTRSIALRFPSSSFAKEYLYQSYADTILTAAMAKPIVDAWLQLEPNSIRIYSNYLELLKRGKIASDTSVMFAQRLVDLTTNREALIRYNMKNPWNMAYVYRSAAQVFVLAGRMGQALAAIKAGQMFVLNADMQSELFTMEGIVWKQSAQYGLAERAFLSALAIGSKTAKDSLLAVYKHIRGTDSNFAAFVKQKTDSIAGAKNKPALTFTVKGLDGKIYDIAKLKGKVVVINFWFINCPPCRIEIPGLNSLVKEYSKKDVIFLALASDTEKDLKEFLKKTPFSYTIVPQSSEAEQLYGIKSYPTHMVIDRKGMNIGQLEGGSETRHEDLRPLIERALGQ